MFIVFLYRVCTHANLMLTNSHGVVKMLIFYDMFFVDVIEIKTANYFYYVYKTCI